VPVSVSVPGRPPSAGRSPRPRVLGRRALGTLAFLGPAILQRCAPLARRRATPCRTTHPPPFMGSRRRRTYDDVFLPLLDRYDHQICPSSLQSEKRRHRPNGGTIAPPSLHSGFAGFGSVLQRPRSAWRLRRPWRCRSRPLLRPAIRRKLAVASDHQLTASPGPRDEALRNSATPTEGSGRRMQIGGAKFEIRNLRGFKDFKELLNSEVDTR